MLGTNYRDYQVSVLKNVFLIGLLLSFTALQCFAQSFSIQELIKLSEIYPEEALEKVEQQLLLPYISASDKAMLQSLKADVAYYVDQPDLILGASEQALASGLLNEHWQVKTLITKARGHFQMKENKLFLNTANDAVFKSDRYDLTILKAASVIERANANALFKNFSESKDDLTLANRYLKALPDSFTKGVMQERYSAALRLLSRFEEAIESQHTAIEIFKKVKSVHFLAISYYNLGRVYDASGDIENAIKNMELSYQWAKEDNNKLNQAFSLSRLAEYQLKLNQVSKAEITLNEALRVADESPSFRVQFLARKDLALLTCTKTYESPCQNALKAAITFAEKFKMTADQGDLLKRLAQAYFQQERHELAYKALKKSMDISDN